MNNLFKRFLYTVAFVFMSASVVYAAAYWLPDYDGSFSIGGQNLSSNSGNNVSCQKFNMLSSRPNGAECDVQYPGKGLRCYNNCRCKPEYAYTSKAKNMKCDNEGCSLNGVTKYKCSECCDEGWTYNSSTYNSYARTVDLKWLLCLPQPSNPLSPVYEPAKCSEGGQCGKCMTAEEDCNRRKMTWCAEAAVCVDKTQGGCCSDSDCPSGACVNNQCMDCSEGNQKLCNGECIDINECCGNAPASGCWCNDGTWETDCRAYSGWDYSCSSGNVDVCTRDQNLANGCTSLSSFCSGKGMVADGDLVACGSKKYGKCKSCPSGYSVGLTASQCDGREPEAHSSEPACKKCLSCAAGYSFTTTIDDCGAGQILETQSGNSACKRCSGASCEAGYSTASKTVNNGYKLETQANNSQCTKLVECKVTCSNTQVKVTNGSSSTNKCEFCQNCPSGYRTDITSASCSSGQKFVVGSGQYQPCGKCEDIACEAGYSTSTTSCADGQTLKSQTTNANCKTCTGTACESGYKTGITCNATTQNTVKQSSNSNCVKCTQKTCEEQGKKTCKGICIEATDCCTDSDCGSSIKQCVNGKCVVSGQMIKCADGYKLGLKETDCSTGYELVSQPDEDKCKKCVKSSLSINPNPSGDWKTHDDQDTCCPVGYMFVCPAGYGEKCKNYKKNRCCAYADKIASKCRTHCTE